MDLTNASYNFHSPGWPNGYAHGLDCNWIFTSPKGTHLTLRLLNLNLEESENCLADHVEVYSGYALTVTPDVKLLGKLCLANSTSVPLHASHVMTVKFHTDWGQNKTGFNAIVYRGNYYRVVADG